MIHHDMREIIAELRAEQEKEEAAAAALRARGFWMDLGLVVVIAVIFAALLLSLNAALLAM